MRIVMRSLKAGAIQAWQNKRMMVLYYLFNLLAGLAVMLPLRSALLDIAGSSLVEERLRGGIDVDFLLEFLVKHSTMVGMVGASVLVAGILYGLGSLFLAGGCLTVFGRGEHFSSAVFWSGAGSCFGRFFRLFLWSIPLFGILYAAQFLESLVVRIFYGSDPLETITYSGIWIRIALGYAAILCYSMIVDYARIYVILTGESRMRVALWKGIMFALKNFPRTFGIVLILTVAGILLFGLYNPVADILHAPAPLVILLLIVLQQLVIFLRMAIRLNLYSSQIHLYRSLAVIPTAAPVI